MKTTIGILLGVLVLVPASSAATWDYESYRSLPAAAAKAKTTGKRLLLGLSGSPF